MCAALAAKKMMMCGTVRKNMQMCRDLGNLPLSRGEEEEEGQCHGSEVEEQGDLCAVCDSQVSAATYLQAVCREG